MFAGPEAISRSYFPTIVFGWKGAMEPSLWSVCCRGGVSIWLTLEKLGHNYDRHLVKPAGG